MRLLSLTAGAAGMYCGSCLRDNALAAALKARGHDVILTPLYTPTTTDEHNVSGGKVLFGGISVYLQQHLALFRHTPAAFDALLDSGPVLRAASKRQIKVDPTMLGEMTVSMLRGREGHQRKEIDKMLRWLRDLPRLDAIALPFTLLIGLAAPLRDAFRVPLICAVQGEDLFLEHLQEPWRSEALALIRGAVEHVDRFTVVSEFYAAPMSRYLGIPADRIRYVPLGISFEGQTPHATRRTPPFTIGFFGRIAPEKGLHLLADAYGRLRTMPGVPNTRLLAAGYLLDEHRPYFDEVVGALTSAGLRHEFEYAGAPDRVGKLAVLARMDVFSMPATYDEPKGLSLLEALGSGVPLVQPARGSFVEIIEKTSGGLLVAPDDPQALSEGLHALLVDRDRAAGHSEAGAARVRQRYSTEGMARAAEDVFRELGVAC